MGDDAELCWTSHPWAEDRPARRTLMVLSVLSAAAVAGYALDSVWLALLSLGILLASVSRYVMPSGYALDASGVRVTHLGVDRTYPWARFRRAALRADGVFLGTFATARRLDIWRGCFLRCPGRRDEVYDYVRTHIVVEPGEAGDRTRSGDGASPRVERG